MMYKAIILSVLAISAFACSNPEANTENISPEAKALKEKGFFVPIEKNGIKISVAQESPAYADASLSLLVPDLNSPIPAGNVVFKYDVRNFELSVQTGGGSHCANSEQGQHIHYIMNNAPYTAHYDPYVETELSDGKHLLLSFLSRSYHESIKNGKAHIVKQVNVGNAEGEDFDLSAPHLFYSRPKGTYTGDDTHHLLLDFFLINADLSEKGFKVKATIDGTEFILNQWVAYDVEGLGNGEHTFMIELIDENGKIVPGPFNNSGERIIKIEGKDV